MLSKQPTSSSEKSLRLLHYEDNGPEMLPIADSKSAGGADNPSRDLPRFPQNKKDRAGCLIQAALRICVGVRKFPAGSIGAVLTYSGEIPVGTENKFSLSSAPAADSHPVAVAP
jgi:hypothetical protein